MRRDQFPEEIRPNLVPEPGGELVYRCLGCRAEHGIESLLYTCPDCGSSPPQGWIVRGPAFTVCNIANLFCFIDNDSTSLNEVIALMRERMANAAHDLI